MRLPGRKQLEAEDRYAGGARGQQVTSDSGRHGVVDDGNVAYAERVEPGEANTGRKQSCRDFEQTGRRTGVRSTGRQVGNTRHVTGAPGCSSIGSRIGPRHLRAGSSRTASPSTSSEPVDFPHEMRGPSGFVRGQQVPWRGMALQQEFTSYERPTHSTRDERRDQLGRRSCPGHRPPSTSRSGRSSRRRPPQVPTACTATTPLVRPSSEAAASTRRSRSSGCGRAWLCDEDARGVGWAGRLGVPREAAGRGSDARHGPVPRPAVTVQATLMSCQAAQHGESIRCLLERGTRRIPPWFRFPPRSRAIPDDPCGYTRHGELDSDREVFVRTRAAGT